MSNFPSHLQKEPCEGLRAPRPCMPYEDGGAGHRKSGVRAGLSLGPCLQLCPTPAAIPPCPPPHARFSAACICAFVLPRAPNHSANSVCGERSPHVISGRISPLYSRLINSGQRYRVMMSYRLQECPPQGEVNITVRAGSPFLWQRILIKSFTPFSCCWLQLNVFKANSPPC